MGETFATAGSVVSQMRTTRRSRGIRGGLALRTSGCL